MYVLGLSYNNAMCVEGCVGYRLGYYHVLSHVHVGLTPINASLLGGLQFIRFVAGMLLH